MKKVYTSIILLLVVLNSYSQTRKSNFQLIDVVKTTAGKSFIEKNIIGFWKFEKLITPEGREITEEVHIITDSIHAKEIINRPNVLFNKNGRYKITRLDDSVDEGKWKYSEEDKNLHFFFDNPTYNIPIDKVNPELLKKLRKDNMIIEFTEDVWEIYEITNDKLVIIEHLPHNQYEFKYNLAVYRKAE